MKPESSLINLLDQPPESTTELQDLLPPVAMLPIQHPKGHAWSPLNRHFPDGCSPCSRSAATPHRPKSLPCIAPHPRAASSPCVLHLPCSAASSPSELSLPSCLWPLILVTPCLSCSPRRLPALGDTLAGWES